MDQNNRTIETLANQGIIEILKDYLKEIPKELGLKEAYLFGSYANGKETESSDMDLALIFDKMEDFFQTQSILRKLRRNIDIRIEPHPLKIEEFNSENPFALEIKETGILIA
jgi:predicted nucleotidyltransferase